MVDLPQPEGPTSATNSPSAMRSVVFDRAGTARSPRPNVTETSDSSIATGAPWLPLSDGIGVPENAGFGCMRIMSGKCMQARCQQNPSVYRGNPEKRPPSGLDAALNQNAFGAVVPDIHLDDPAVRHHAASCIA